MSQGVGMCNGVFKVYLSTLHVNQINNDLKLPSHTSAVLHTLPFVREHWEWTAAFHLGNGRENKLFSSYHRIIECLGWKGN